MMIQLYILVGILIFLLISILIYFKAVVINSINRKNNIKLDYMIAKNSIKYTSDVLDFIKDFTRQEALIQFHQFKDKIDFSKFNESLVKQLISDISHKVQDSINWDHLHIDKSIITFEYYENYIISTTVIIVKELIERIMNNE